MPAERPPADLTRQELLALIEQLCQQVATLQAEVERLRRAEKRQATPFSKGSRVEHPKKPGRKPGQGPFTYRANPSPEALTEPLVEVPVTTRACPGCGGLLLFERTELAYVTELPEVVLPKVTAYEVAVCRCLGCGKPVRGTHPELAPDQYGATAHRVGPRAMAAAHLLHYGLGLPQRKVPAVLELLAGIPLTQGALAQDALRRVKGGVGVAYQQLRAAVKTATCVHTDDTSWKVGGVPAYLMTFETPAVTVYQIRGQHRNDEVRELIPSDYAGTMICDRGRSYEAKELAGVKQQKCLGHIQRSIAEVLVTKKGPAREFPSQLKGLLSECLALWHAYHAGTAPDFEARRDHLQEAVTELLSERVLSDWDNQRLRNELGRHHHRGNLLRFLFDPSLEPTNNRAERALRPAVIARKVSQCSKNERGAEAFAAFASVVRTLTRRRAGSVVGALCQLFRSGGLQPLAP